MNQVLTAAGQLFGDFNGARDFAVRLLTADEVITALELAVMDCGTEVTQVRVRKYEVAQVLTIGGKTLTPAEVGGLLAADYALINAELGAIEKKLQAPTAPAVVQSPPKNTTP